MDRHSNSRRAKKRRVPSARSEPVREPTPQIFENTRIYIHPININGSRRNVLHNLIQKKGGSYTLVPDAETTHVLVDEGVSSGKLCRAVGWTTFPPNINVLMVSWLSASVRAGWCLNPIDYEIPCTHRPTFATVHRCGSAATATATGPIVIDVISDATTSVLSEDADVEMQNFENCQDDGSTFDDGKYDEETTCDDEWLHEFPIIPSHTTGVGNTCDQNQCGKLPMNSFSSASNFRSRVPTPPSNNTNSNNTPSTSQQPNTPAVPCDKTKLNNKPVTSRPNTIAAQLSRVRVRKIPEHLRVPGGSSIIVDLNKESVPSTSSKNTADDKTTNQNAMDTFLNGIQSTNTDEKCKKKRMKYTSHAESKTSSTDEKCKKKRMKYRLHAESKTSSTDEKCKKIRMEGKSHAESKTETEPHCQDQNTDSSADISKDKGKTSATGFSPDEQFDVESVNEVSQVLTMMVESVFEVAVNEKIINESVEEISKNEMENDNSAGDTLKKETIHIELVSDVLTRVVDDVVKAEADVEIKIVQVESLNTNCGGISEILNQKDTVKFSKQSGALTVENEVNALGDEACTSNELSNSEPMEVSWENQYTESLKGECFIPAPVSQLLMMPPPPSPYPIRLFRSGMSDSSGPGNSVDDQTKQEPVECITPEIGHPSNVESSENEVANNSNALSADPEIIPVENQARSCRRPDITGPNIFFPFPNSTAASSSRNTLDFNDPNSAYLRSYRGENLEIIKKLQLFIQTYKVTGEKWRCDAYEKAIILLIKHRKPVESLEEILSIKGMSRKIAQKIWILRQTGHLKEIDEICGKRFEETRKLFSRVWGISPRLARKLCKEECYTLTDLAIKANLSRSELVGISYYDDLNTKMPKREATRIFFTVLKVIFEKYPKVQCDACSSLRRNKKFCGHVSILITLPRGINKNDHRALPNIVAKLHQLGYITDDLIRHEENGEQTKYVGIFKLGPSSKPRRIDITVCIREEYACAIFFLTGSSYFNRAVQQLAIKKDMVLDEHSLRFRILNARGGTDAVTRLYTPEERSIFLFLELPYRTPEQRDRFIM